jgi:cobalt-zinc-cadmium efflux system protein
MTTDSFMAGAQYTAAMSDNHHAHDHHGHDHDGHGHAHGMQSGTLLGVALALTGSFMLVEFAGGILARSLALLADAGHMLTDTAALALAWAATRIAARPADRRRTFGYQRLRVLAAFVNGCALLFIVAWIAFEAVQRLWNPVAVNATAILWVGGLGLCVNLAVFAMLRRGDSHDMNISAASLHVLGDLLGSAAAVLAGLIVLLTGWLPIDPLLSLVVSVLIVRSAWALVHRSAHILMEGAPDWLDIGDLRNTLEQRIPAIRDVHHVHAWLVGPQETLLTMHASVTATADHAVVLKDAKILLAERFGITHATIQIEVEDCVDEDCVGERKEAASL